LRSIARLIAVASSIAFFETIDVLLCIVVLKLLYHVIDVFDLVCPAQQRFFAALVDVSPQATYVLN
jgi:hypothetical protein